MGAGKSKSVLIVEDEPVIAEALVYLLQREGLEVAVRGDGEAALEVLHSEPPDLMILDIMLPGISGMEVLETVRRDNALRSLPVLMLTAKGQRKDRSAAEEAGASLFITKPFSNAELVGHVKDLLA